MLYHYFPGKRDFYVEVATVATNRLLAATDVGDAGSSLERLEATMAAYVAYLERYPAGFMAIHRGSISDDARVRSTVERYKRTQIRRALADLGRDEGEDPRLELALRGWLAFVLETSLEHIKAPVLSSGELAGLFVAAMQALIGSGGVVRPKEVESK